MNPHGNREGELKLKSLLLLPFLVTTSCEVTKSENSSDAKGSSQNMGQWFQLKDRSQVWFSMTDRGADLFTGTTLRCWPKDSQYDCLYLLNGNNTYTSATRFQVPTLDEADAFLKNWRPRFAYNCTFDGMVDPPSESIRSSEKTLYSNHPLPDETFVPWTKKVVTAYLKQAGGKGDSFVNCRNIALMIRKNGGSHRVIWEGDVGYNDIAF